MSHRSSSAGSAGKPLPPRELLAAIELLLLDVDGVMTDGRIWFDPEGREYKSFHVMDAAGLAYWHRCGGISGFLSGRGGHVVELRSKQLGIHEVHLGTLQKEQVFEDILARRGLRPEQVAYVGDDLLDLPVLRRSGLAATVPEGRDEVKAEVHFVTHRSAGFGAARDVIDLLLQQRGAFAAIVQRGGLG